MTQVNPSTITQVKEPHLAQNVLRVLKVMIPLVVVIKVISLFLVFRLSDKRLLGVTASILTYFIANLVSLRLIRHKQPILAAQLLVYELPLTLLGFTLFVAGFG